MNANMDIIKVKNNLTKLRFYRISEVNNFDDIKNHLNQMLSNYSSTNVDLFKDNINSIVKKFSIIKKIHYNNYHVIETNINTYIDVSNKVSKMFNDIK